VTDHGLFVGILGPLAVRRDGRDVRIGSGKQRLVLGALAVAGRALARDELIDVLWGEEAPATAIGTLQSHVSRLRAQIGSETLVDVGGAYRLELGQGQLDAAAFTTAVASGRAARDRGERDAARRQLRAGLSLWRGPALATFRYEPFAQLEIARLEALRLEALEDRCELDIQVGNSSVVTELEALTAEHPFRERLTLLLMTALFRAGRQADALSAAHRLRHTLREDLGVDPTPEVDALERRILDHDPDLAAVPDPLPRRHWHTILEHAELPTPAPERRCDHLIVQAVGLRRAGRLNEARSSAAAAVRLASGLEDRHRLGAAALSLAGPPEDAVLREPLDTDLLERALAALPVGDPLVPMLRARLAVGYIDAGDRERGTALLAAAEAAASTGPNRQVELYVLRARHRTWFDPAALDERVALTRRIADVAAGSGHIEDRAWASRWLAIDLLEAGDLDGFDRCIHDLADANERIHDVFHQWSVVTRRAGHRTATGPLDEADALTMEALNLASGIGSEYTLAATSSLVFVLRWRQQRLEELDGLVQDVATREPHIVRPILPLLHLELDRHDDARRSLRDLTRQGLRAVLAAEPVGSTHLMTLTVLSQASLHLDDHDAAAQLLDELNAVQSTMAVMHPGITVLAPIAELRAAVLGCLGQLDEAITHAEIAVELCASTGCAAVGVRANALLALLLHRRQRGDDRHRIARLGEEIQRLVKQTGAVPPPWYDAQVSGR
jgi:DNA-binding SARP family transcriptional activator